jgi:hypothetical protein
MQAGIVADIESALAKEKPVAPSLDQTAESLHLDRQVCKLNLKIMPIRDILRLYASPHGAQVAKHLSAVSADRR